MANDTKADLDELERHAKLVLDEAICWERHHASCGCGTIRDARLRTVTVERLLLLVYAEQERAKAAKFAQQYTDILEGKQ